MIAEHRLAPTRLGINISRLSLINVVVVMPSCSVPERHPEAARIYRMDKLVSKIRGQEPAPLDVFRIVSQETLYEFAKKLANFNCPAREAQVAISKPVSARRNVALPRASGGTCQGCNGTLQNDEARFCRSNNGRFSGQLLCRRCQNYAPKNVRASAPKSPQGPRLSKTNSVAYCVEPRLTKKLNTSAMRC